MAGDFGENGEKKEANLFEISEETSAAADWVSGRGSPVEGERLISVSSIEPSGAFAGAPSSEVGDEGGMEPGASSFGLTSRLEAFCPPAISISTADEEMTVPLLSLSAERVSFFMFFAGKGCLGASRFPPRLTYKYMHDARSTIEPSTTPIAIAPPVESPSPPPPSAEESGGNGGGGDGDGGGGDGDAGGAAGAWTLTVTGA